ncbi:C45 family autoproteolytic acyltransferase/hydolase [Anaeromyxobacter oryzae]|uniref:Peptidase C45 hydrolase domain-containing protein n=1 Tax=Anaeromyxobacter oryzae TaxID=2918170 RepID=A0ABM7X4E9_9BACT|nr:C45 family peptidase [Anaeromyxobacter oryzae]BDG06685.1 hypothetical protein AMOR_56810 [Anaeromyxobacter oryzae]
MALRVEERIVAGEDGDAIVVHHLVLHGSNRAIGRHLGDVARARYHLAPAPAIDPLRARVQREWLRRNAPVLFERMRGVADAFRVDVGADGLDLSRLGAPPPTAGCSAIFLPPRATAVGHPLVSRAFDFAAPVAGRAPPGVAPAASRPYVLETHPDEGHAALALVAFDLLGAALDGVNAEGLCVVAASDVESPAAEPDPAGIGLDELQIGRVLLDSCATAQEARELLLSAKHHYAAVPAHWLVADRHGDAFVFEVGPGRNRVHLVEARAEPLVLTNHPLHRYPADEALPRAAGPVGTYARYRLLRAALAEALAPWRAEALGAVAERAFVGPAGCDRTLWHGVYDLAERSLEATFFLRDEPDPARARGTRTVRTPALRFELQA